MCGISGKLSWDNPPDRHLIQCMNDRLVHRGPDAEGIYIQGPLGLGHRRLSIIDLSQAGNQPLSDRDEQFWLVFNGEIYNYRELRSQLLQTGASFRTKTDTEVIIEAYKYWGVDCLERFNGMFAFALWNRRQQTLFLARDRLGIKPLYYQTLPDGGIVFASELKALREDPQVSDRVNVKALSHYLSLNYTLTAECMIQGVKKLEAAHYLLIQKGKTPRETRYWNLAAHFQQKQHFQSEEEASEALAALIQDAVKLRTIADVPVGAFLSGGVDSSTIVANLCHLRPSNRNLTFSIGFQEKSYNELEQARFVANFLKVSHRDRIITSKMTDCLPQIVWHADEPFADTSIIPMYYLAQLARQSVTVCLSGDGADEIFAGYETYSADRLHQWSRSLPNWTINWMMRSVDRFLPISYNKVSFDYKLRKFLAGHSYTPIQAHYSWRTIFSEEEKQSLLPDYKSDLEEANPLQYFQQYQQDVPECHYLDQAMYVDIKTWLVDDILVKVDRSTMAHALEARVPMLDFRLVEFAASLPVKFKLNGWQKKYLLKKSQKFNLPTLTLQRSKQGFNAPISYWIERDAKKYAGDRKQNFWTILNANYIQNLLEEHTTKTKDNSLKIFSAIVFGLWQQSLN
ncbi:MAG: asparagine synthase (glutamine-hydrolyzing) [Cyanobacteria bacterium P01_E01_bin.42]